MRTPPTAWPRSANARCAIASSSPSRACRKPIEPLPPLKNAWPRSSSPHTQPSAFSRSTHVVRPAPSLRPASSIPCAETAIRAGVTSICPPATRPTPVSSRVSARTHIRRSKYETDAESTEHVSKNSGRSGRAENHLHPIDAIPVLTLDGWPGGILRPTSKGSPDTLDGMTTPATSPLALPAICLGYFMVILDATAVNLSLPALGADLG